MISVVFFGTNKYSVPSLKALIDNKDIDVKLVVTKEDKKVNRGQKIEETDVAKIAKEHNIEVYKPKKIKEDIQTINRLKEVNADYFIVISYGQILSKEILLIPKASINAHGSLLPKYRGASPIQTAILNGEKVTGVTTMLMDEGFDTGDILLKKEININDEDDEETLFNKLSLISADLLIDTIFNFDNIKPIKQDDASATKSKLIDKLDAEIKEEYNSDIVFNMVRAYKTWPTCFINYKDDVMKIIKVEKINDEELNEINNKKENINDRLYICNKKLYLKTNDGFIHILKLKLPGKKEIDDKSFINGLK